jgi:dihydropteroate synthase
MQQLPSVKDIIPAVRQGLAASLRRALQAGVEKRRILLDPGIGFGKSVEQNFELVRSLPRLASLGCPILLGPSRKSFVRRTLEELHLSVALRKKKGELVSEGLLFGTAATVAAAILNGAHIVRVHDVREMTLVARIADRI